MPSDRATVPNQSPPFVDVDLVACDAPLRGAFAAFGNAADAAGLASLGAEWGAADRFDLARLANAHPPILHTHDPRGERIDYVEFHPAYHALMQASIAGGLHASTWDGGSHVARAVRQYVTAGVESGHVCPTTMTHASLAALGAAPEIAREWRPRILSRRYDPRPLPFWEKSGVTLGMGMTERQGGTDVRANTTRAEPLGNPGEYALTGHKWFMSAPMSDAFLVLAQAQGGLTCFLMPRHAPDGTRNGLRFQRLKDKLGNRSNASSEVEFERAFAWRIGEEGRGVRAIIGMVQLTRLDCVTASTGLARMALAQALHHARHREVFGKRLVDQLAMRAVLADLALEIEAMTALGLRLAKSFDAAARDLAEAAFARCVTPAAKLWVCKAVPGLVYEAMECLGGNGYVEESILPRLYREAPVNAIWEGSGNVMALDLMRSARERDLVEALLGALMSEAEGLPGVPALCDDLRRAFAGEPDEFAARRTAENLALLAAAGALASCAPAPIAEAFATTRIASPRRMIGSNPVEHCATVLLERSLAAENGLPSGITDPSTARFP